ncbi:DUF6907 domain-containing protein [Streptomyces sp. CACIS-1.16CA]|uniref:DUF6907 domain-containing protein n=1 Tax=Streptomyces sp. CACIS-1.16CA TaxID=1175510 RepID=UPI0037D00D12
MYASAKASSSHQHIGALTAAERGPEWMATYSCTPWCAMDHNSPGNTFEWHQAAPAIIPPLDVLHDEGDGEPFLTAHVTTVNFEPDVFGIESELWIWSGGRSYELDEEQTDRLIADIESFLPHLRAARTLLAEARKGDRPCDPAARAKADAEREERVAATREVEVAKTEPAPAPPLSAEQYSEMVRVPVRAALQHAQDVPAMARAMSAAVHAAIREAGAEPYLCGCGEGNLAYKGMLPCVLPYGHSGDHRSSTGEAFAHCTERARNEHAGQAVQSMK